MGLSLAGDQPITPRTNAFLVQHNMHVQQQGGFVTLTGNFSLAKTDVDAFLAQKKSQDEANGGTAPTPPKP